jgi:hypothetical protein
LRSERQRKTGECEEQLVKSSENTFAQLLAIEGNQWHYHIPRFQREYVWGKYNWSKLLEDIYDNDPGHYMGSIICVHEGADLTPNSELVYEVVDGQQRLATLSLLLAAIYQKLNTLAADDPALSSSEDFIIRRNGVKRRLFKQMTPDGRPLPWWVFKSGSLSYCLRILPSTQESNLADYQCILKEIGLLPKASTPRYLGNRRIYKAFDYFRRQMPGTMPEVCDLLDRVYALSFIHITEASQAKAFMLFETLNYRGVPLSAIDIIKNKMLAVLESRHNVPIDDSYSDWQQLLANLTEDRDQDRFLRQFYNAFKFDAQVKVEGITRATGSRVIAIYETLIRRDAQALITDLIQKATVYNQFIEPVKYRPSDLTAGLVQLDRIGAAPAYTFLLYLFSLPADVFSEPGVREKTVMLLSKYYFRRNVTDFPNTRDLDGINIDLVEQCQAERDAGRKVGFNFLSQAILAGRGRPAPLRTLREALKDNLFYNNGNMARYALTRLDEANQNREYAPNLWERNEKGLYVWTVEHVFPQGRNIPSDWVGMIANHDKNEAERIQGECVHCLGNLTLTGYNSKLSNQSFTKKQDKTAVNVFGNQIFVGYKNGLALNGVPFAVRGQTISLATADRWTREHILARNEVMVDMLIDILRFDVE